MSNSENFANATKWFLQFQGQVSGPFNTQKLQNKLHEIEDAHLEKTLVWKRGLTEWLKANKWSPEIEQSIEHTVATPLADFQARSENTVTQAAVNLTSVNQMTKTVTPDFKNDQAKYQVQLNFVDQPLMTRKELLAFVASYEDVSAISIKDPGSQEWKEVYAYPDIVEKLGLSRRKHPRVPILAQFNGRTNNNPQFNSRIITISEGGMGFTDVYDLKIGDEVEGQITSPHFFQPINIQADVVYSGLDGYIGLKFNRINEESRSAIIDYIKKFGKSVSS